MRYESIADIYSANEKIRRQFLEIAGAITPEEAAHLAEDEKWTPQQLVEHVAMVTGGVTQICSRLLTKAKSSGSSADGSFALSPSLIEQFAGSAATKLEAPDIVQPSGSVPLAESLGRLAASDHAFEGLRTDLETTDLTDARFPHPYFGPLNAAEWLLLAGLHEARHARQLEKMIAKVRSK